MLTAALGVALGVGWVLLTGAAVARSYGVPLGAGIVGYRMLRDGLGMPLGGMILMLLPAVIVRLLRPPTREALDGFIIGALGALSFTAAATLTRLAPQFTTGLVSKRAPGRPARGGRHPGSGGAADRGGRRRVDRRRPVVHPAAEQGARAAGRRAFGARAVRAGGARGLPGPRPGRRRPVSASAAVGPASGLAVVALLVLRIGLHLALLHEAHDEIQLR